MDLDRQELPPPRADEPPQRVPEVKPTLLGDWFIYLSIIVLFCGVIAITALTFGEPNLRDPLIRVPVLIGAALLVAISADATLRLWRSAWAWLPVNRGRGWFRFVWALVVLGVMIGSAATVVGFLVI